MHKTIAVLALLLCAPYAVADEPGSKVAARPWSHEQSDVPPHPAATWGKLDNGLRYVIMPTKAAPARASLRMLVLVGSGHETDEQQGVAHFLEHMAFNGTRHFPAGETFEYFQRLGMAFGAHTNAETEIDRTVYQLELPRANEELLGDGLKLFRDFLDGILLDENEIEKERGVVLSEQTAGNTAGYRSAVGNIRAALAGTKAADRMPIGKIDVIRRATRKQFVDFYETWYTPGRTVIVAVGDFHRPLVERLIRERFADAKARRGEAADESLGTLRTGKGLSARYSPVPDAGTTTVSLVRSTPVDPKMEQMVDQRDDLLDIVVDHMFNVRLERLQATARSTLLAAAMDDERLYNLADRRHISARCPPEKWADALGLLEREMRRAVKLGFTEAELELARSNVGTLLDNYFEQLEMRQPADLAGDILKSIYEHAVFPDPAVIVALVKRELPTITKAECDARFRKYWDAQDVEISLTGNARLKSNEQILATFEASTKLPVDAGADDESKQFVYTKVGERGEIVSRREHSDLGVVQAVFANNVRVNIKSTKQEKNKVRMVVRFGGGTLELPADKPGLQIFATSAFISGGLKKLTFAELGRVIDGKFVGVSFGVGDDAFQLAGNCLTSSLELQLQICAAYLTEPAFRKEVAPDFFAAMESLEAQRKHTLEGKLRYDGACFLRSGDARYSLPEGEALKRLTIADVAAWMAKPLAEGYMEVTLVGDVDPDVALECLADTLGALPKRAAAKPDFAEAKRLRFPADTRHKHFDYAADTPRGLASVFWPVPGRSDLEVNRRLYVLNLILADRVRLKMREELGAAYTPEVQYFSADAFPDYGFIAAHSLVDPTVLKQIGGALVDVATELAKGTISDDEFARAIKPYLSTIDAETRDNGYWLGAICASQERPTTLDDIRSKKEAYATMKKADVEGLAKRYLTRDAATTMTITPASTAGGGASQ